MNDEQQIRHKICQLGKRLYQKNYIVGQDGNISSRLNKGIITTPSGFCKGELTPDDLIVVDHKGKKLAGKHSVTSEIKMHLSVYQQRPDVTAVVHAHPPLAVALTLTSHSLEEVALPEVIVYLGGIAIAPYATPGSEELCAAIRPLLADNDAILLARHGSLTFGSNLEQAYHKLEYTEYTAQVMLAAWQHGPVAPLSQQEVVKLQKIRQQRQNFAGTTSEKLE